MHKYYIGISISELQQWLADDSLTFARDRVWHSCDSANTLATDANLDALFNRLPAFCLDDQAGVLIAEIDAPYTWSAVADPAICNIALDTVKRFIPLTADARSALLLIWSDVIHLDEAVVDVPFNRFRIKRKAESSNISGERLVNVFIDCTNGSFTIKEFFLAALPGAILAAEQRASDEIIEILGGELCHHTLMSQAFRYTRRKVIDSSDNLKSFVDVGIIISDFSADIDLIDRLRTFCKSFQNKAGPSLLDVCSSPALSMLQAKFNFADQVDNHVISLISLGLFLRWKQAFHDNRSVVNSKNIYLDISSLVGKVAVAEVAIALWMFGAYLGMDYVAPLYRSVSLKAYPALKLFSNAAGINRFPAWSFFNHSDTAASDAVVIQSPDRVASELEVMSRFIDTGYEVAGALDAERNGPLIPAKGIERNPEPTKLVVQEHYAVEVSVSVESGGGDRSPSHLSIPVNFEMAKDKSKAAQPKKNGRQSPPEASENKKNKGTRKKKNDGSHPQLPLSDPLV